jgi:iron complex outermembrane recepter protein
MKSTLLMVFCAGVLTAALPTTSLAQEASATTEASRYFKKKPTKREILRMKVEVLRDLSLEEITELADIAGVSSLEELIKLIVTTASKSAESLFDAPLPISAITGEDIQRAGATSIMEALRLVPGVIVREITAGNYDVHIRGLDAVDKLSASPVAANNSITLVMVNNRIVYNDYQGTTYWDNLPFSVDDIERIEVVRGPASSMYGANAVAGVIHFITKRPNAQSGASVSSYSQAGSGSTILGNAGLSFAPENSPFSLRIAGNVDNRNRNNVDYYHYRVPNPMGGADIIPAGFQDRVDPRTTQTSTAVLPSDSALATRRLSGNLHAAYTMDDFNLNLAGGYITSKVQRSNTVAGNPTLISQDSTWSGFGHLWGNYKSLSFSADVNTGFLNSSASVRSPIAINLDWVNVNINLEHEFTLGENFKMRNGLFYRSTAMGSGFMNNRRWNESQNAIQKTAEDRTQSLISYFARAEYKFDALRIIGAVRLDRFQFPGRIFVSPQLMLTYKIGNDVLLRASYGRSLRTPFMINLYNEVPPTPFGAFAVTVEGNKNQLPLTAQSFEAGIRANLSEWLSIDAEGFLMDAQDYDRVGVVGVVGMLGTLPLVKLSFSNIALKPRQIGGTFSLTAAPSDNFKLQAFVTLQNTQIVDFENGAGMKSSFQHLATPPYYGGFVMNYTPIDRLNINLNSYFSGVQTMEFDNNVSASVPMSVDANFILNATLGYEIIDGLRVFVNGRNLLGSNARQYGFSDRIGTVITGGINLNF